MTDRAWARRMAALIRQPAFIASVTVVVLALIAGGLAWQVGHKGDSAHGKPLPGRRRPVGDRRRSDDPWASLGPVESLEPQPSDPTVTTAVLTATAAPGPVVPTDTAFQLASADTTPASVLAARLTVEPALALAVAPDAGDRIARLTPIVTAPAGRRLPIRAPRPHRGAPRLVGVPGQPAAADRRDPARGRVDGRPGRYRDRTHLRPGRRHRCRVPRHDHAGDSRPVRAARSDHRLRR